jgi:hypothetical protein
VVIPVWCSSALISKIPVLDMLFSCRFVNLLDEFYLLIRKLIDFFDWKAQV